MAGRLDQSREALLHAQKIANLFVDEARLSSNEFAFVMEEHEALAKLADADAYIVKVPVPAARIGEVDGSEEQMVSELFYL